MKVSVKDEIDKQIISDLALGWGTLPKADSRIQVKMPRKIVDQLDRVFPGVDRSKVLTMLAVKAIEQKNRFKDQPKIGQIANGEQFELDEMWNYLDERESGV